MPLFRKLFDAVARDRRWWWALLAINLLGSLYGFYWYWPQLQETPIKYWLIVPDSPGSTFLLSFWLIFLLAGVDWRKPAMQVLGAIAFISNMKYGLWSAVILPEAGIKYGWEFDYVHLSLSHLGMCIQAFIFSRYYRPAMGPAVIAWLWMGFQDLVDYRLLMTHPTLPYKAEFAFARGVAFALSTIWGLFLVVQGSRSRRQPQALDG